MYQLSSRTCVGCSNPLEHLSAVGYSIQIFSYILVECTGGCGTEVMVRCLHGRVAEPSVYFSKFILRVYDVWCIVR